MLFHPVLFHPVAKIIAGLSLTLTFGSAAHPGTISTIAGGTGGPARATSVALALPCAEVYARGALYFTDAGLGFGGLIRKIDTHTDVLSTVAGDGDDGAIPDGGLASGELSEVLTCAGGVAVDHAGNVIFSQDAANGQPPPRAASELRVVAASTGTFYGQAMLAGHVYTIGGTGTTGYSGDGGPAVDARLHDPGKLAVDPAGNVIIADGGHRLRVIAAVSGTFYGVTMAAGDIYTVAGDGLPGHAGDGGLAVAAHVSPGAVRVDHHGNLVIADVASHIIRVVPDVSGTYYRQAMKPG